VTSSAIPDFFSYLFGDISISTVRCIDQSITDAMTVDITPNASILTIIVILALVSLLTVKRGDVEKRFIPLSKRATDQLKGLAIIFLLIGHLSLRCIPGEQITENTGAWAVVIFLALSGATLVKAYGMSNLSCRFIFNRIRRLAFPLWITLALVYVLDYLLLGKTYQWLDIFTHFAGLSANVPPLHTEWFVTYVLFLYTAYFLVSKLPATPMLKFIVLLCVVYSASYIIVKNKYFDVLQIWLAYTLVFPLGVIIGIYRKDIFTFYDSWLQSHKVSFIISLAILFVSYDYLTSMSTNLALPIKAAFNALKNIFFIMSILMLSCVLDTIRFESRFLLLMGKYSYEIFLLHYPFMVSYNFILSRQPLYNFFIIYLIIIIVMSIALQKIANKLNRAILPA